MKVYIVTDGEYSDYMIERVFSNREAAEEYKKWHNIHNEIEEYEIYDEPFTKEDGEPAMFIRVQGIVYPEAVVDLRYDIRHNMIRLNRSNSRGAGISDYHRSGVFTIYNYHYIPADKWDLEKYKNKFTKALYDLAAKAKAMFAEGASIRDVELALSEYDEEEAYEE
jgi:hypothetical protein